MQNDQVTLQGIFLPHETRRRKALLDDGRRLIHYTSASAAVSIIQHKRVWMRNILGMNDYMEVAHGIGLMQRSFTLPVDTVPEGGLRAILSQIDEIFPDLSKECIDQFGSWLFQIRNKTYVACLSEHDQSENELGRLSMWRSYTANQVGVGIVINPTPLYSIDDSLGAFSSPVYYMDDKQINGVFFEVVANIQQNKQFISSNGRDKIRGYIFALLRGIATCTKHPGFHEEKEWRIMHTDGVDPIGALEIHVESINGFPQPVYKIPLENGSGGLNGIGVPDLIERVIIGPTQFPIPVSDALILELQKAGVADPEKKVVFSNIPLRT